MPEEYIEFEETFPKMTEEEAAELKEKVDWDSTEEDSVPKVGDSAEAIEEMPTGEDGTQEQPEVDEGDSVEYELPDGTKVTAEQIQEMLGYDKRFKDTQADYTRVSQEKAELARELMQMKYQQQAQQPVFQPEYQAYQQQPFQPQQLEDNYATETERRLAEELRGVKQRVQQIDYNNRLRDQADRARRADELVDSFRSNHGDLSEDEVAGVINKALDSGTFDLELVYRGMRDIESEREAIRKQAREELMADLKNKGKAKLEPAGAPTKEEPPLDVSKLSDEQIEALMTADAKRIFKG